MGKVYSCLWMAAVANGSTGSYSRFSRKKDYREDLWVRQDFLESHSGRVFCMSCPVSDFDLELVTHAAGSTGM